MILQTEPTAFDKLKARLISTTRQLLAPPPHLPLSDWSTANRVIGATGGAPFPGPYDWRKAPYQRGILDTMGQQDVRKVVLCMAAQTAKTTCLENFIAYHMAEEPTSVMFVLPTINDATVFATTRLTGMIQESPRLKALVVDKSKKTSGDRMFQKVFPGGSVEVVTAGSETAFRMRSIRVMLMDEVDGYAIGKEGQDHPVDVAADRLSAFWNSKMILASTPMDLSTSRIWPEFLSGDQRFYYVPCPKCQHMQRLEWERLQWFNDDAKTVHYVCANESCGYHIHNHEKLPMLEKGEWRATMPDNPYPSFHLSVLYSPLRDWELTAGEWIDARGNQEARRRFKRSRLAEPWQDKKVSTTLDTLKSRRKVYDARVPTGVGCLTAGVDVQANRIEVAVWGWGHGESAFYIDSHQILIEPSRDEAWQELTKFITQPWQTPTGTIQLSAVAIDSGYATDFVYRYVQNYNNRHVFAIKGSGTAGARLLSRPNYSKNKRNAEFFYVGTQTAKDALYAMFANPDEDGPRTVRFPLDVEDETLHQLLSEQSVTKWKNMRSYQVWEPINSTTRNEMLDCLVYARAALAFLNNYGDLQRLAEKNAGVNSTPLQPVSDTTEEADETESEAITPTVGLIPAPVQQMPQRKPPQIVYKPVKSKRIGW